MSWEVLVGIVSLLGGVIGIFNQIKQMRDAQDEQIKKQAERDIKLDDRLTRLEEKVDSHNGYAEKFMSLSDAIIEMKTDIKWLKEK